jgi:hypothetical protein
MEHKVYRAQRKDSAARKRENIKKICSIIFNVSTVVVIAWSFFGLMMIILDIWASLGLPKETVSIGIGWLSFEAQLLGFTGTDAFIPIINVGWIPAGIDNVVLTTLVNAFIIGLFVFCMVFIRSIFKDLKNGGSPFSIKIVWATYGISAFMLSNAFHSGRFNWEFFIIIPSALVALIAFIFDYGRILQEESDTTL